MTSGWSVGSTPLDDFLSESGSATDAGERLQRLGLFGSTGGLILAIGLLVFLAVVHRGRHREVTLILRTIAIASGVALVGAVIEILGLAWIDDLGWLDALADAASSASMMRLLAALLLVLGLFDHVVPIGTHDHPPTGRASADDSDENSDRDSDRDSDDHSDDGRLVRWVPSSVSAFGFGGALVGVLSFWFDGHTVTEGPRVIHAVVDLVHVGAASVWFGGVVGLALVAWLRRGTRESTAPLVVRFSTIAALALVLVALAGSLMTLLITDDLGDVTGTDWGRVLLVKLAVVALTVAIGGYHHFFVVPALDSADAARVVVAESHVRRTLVLEAALFVVVVGVTVVLTTASTT